MDKKRLEEKFTEKAGEFYLTDKNGEKINIKDFMRKQKEADTQNGN